MLDGSSVANVPTLEYVLQASNFAFADRTVSVVHATLSQSAIDHSIGTLPWPANSEAIGEISIRSYPELGVVKKEKEDNS